MSVLCPKDSREDPSGYLQEKLEPFGETDDGVQKIDVCHRLLTMEGYPKPHLINHLQTVNETSGLEMDYIYSSIKGLFFCDGVSCHRQEVDFPILEGAQK